MGNSASSPHYNHNNHIHINNNLRGSGGLQQESDFVEQMIADVDITCIKQHLKSGKPSKEFMFLENEDLEEEESCEAQKLYNREKNRYTNILPCDSTRVKLSTVEGVEGSDYINANFIDGELNGTERAYIATQGPLMHTRSDFWRMVWENNCATVVMLGKERENDRVKCDRYWPEPDGTLTFGPLVVRGKGKEDDAGRGITVRRLELANTKLNEIRPIVHFQYEGWPDHGVPTSAKPIRHLIRLLEKERGDGTFSNGGEQSDDDTSSNSSAGSCGGEKSPVVVHCSAGVGRTGTFCTIHMLLVRLHNEMEKGRITHLNLNLYNTVLKLRRQRPGMVQQQEQYVFCYEAVAEEAEELGLVQAEPINTPNILNTSTNTLSNSTSGFCFAGTPLNESI